MTKGIRSAVIGAGVVLVLGMGAGGAYWALHTTPAKTGAAITHQAEQKPATDLTYGGQEGKNALDLLKTHATVVTKDSSYGPYVDSINGLQGGVGGKYWTFYVNGKEASVGAAAYITKTGDVIEWKLQ